MRKREGGRVGEREREREGGREGGRVREKIEGGQSHYTIHHTLMDSLVVKMA